MCGFSPGAHVNAGRYKGVDDVPEAGSRFDPERNQGRNYRYASGYEACGVVTERMAYRRRVEVESEVEVKSEVGGSTYGLSLG